MFLYLVKNFFHNRGTQINREIVVSVKALLIMFVWKTQTTFYFFLPFAASSSYVHLIRFWLVEGVNLHPASFFIEKKEEKNHSEQHLSSCHDNPPYPITRGKKKLCVAVIHTAVLCLQWFEGRSKSCLQRTDLLVHTRTHTHRQTARKQCIHFTTKEPSSSSVGTSCVDVSHRRIQ